MITEKNKRVRRQLLNIPVDDLTLNFRNPRHNTYSAQEEIIEYLLENEDIIEIAEHIAEHGQSETDIPAVIGEGCAYTVIDGNRRVCAVKLLQNPKLSSDVDLQKRFTKIINSAIFSIPGEMECRVYEDNKDFDVWMSLNHESNQKASRKKWNSEQKGRFFKRSVDRLASQLLYYGRKNNLLVDLGNKRITTTLTRYLSTHAVREAMGIVDNRDLWVSLPETEFKQVSKKFMSDAVTGVINSRIGMKIQQREDYGTELTRFVGYKTKRLEKPQYLVPLEWDNGNKSEIKPLRPRPKRKSVLIRKSWGNEFLTESSMDRRIKTVLGEIHRIDYKTNLFAVGCMLRMINEVIIIRFLTNHGQTLPDNNQKMYYERAAEVLEKLSNDEKKKKKKRYLALRQAGSSKNIFLSPDVQSTWVHGTNSPTSADLENIWQNFEDCMLEMLKLGKAK